MGLMQMDQEKQRDERLWVGKPRDDDGKKDKSRAAESGAEKPGAEWTGVVGFFHPFWYVPSHAESWVSADLG